MYGIFLLYTVTSVIARPFPQNEFFLNGGNEITLPDVIGQLPDETTEGLNIENSPQMLFATNEIGNDQMNDEQIDTSQFSSEPAYLSEAGSKEFLKFPGSTKTPPSPEVQQRIDALNEQRRQLNIRLDNELKKRRKSKSGQSPQPEDSSESTPEPSNLQNQLIQIGSQLGSNFQQLLLITGVWQKTPSPPSTTNNKLSHTDIIQLVQKLADQGRVNLGAIDPQALIASIMGIAPSVGIALHGAEGFATVAEALPEIVSALVVVIVGV